MKKLTILAFSLLLALSACAKTPATQLPTELPAAVLLPIEPTAEPTADASEPSDTYVDPLIEIGGIGWTNAMPTENLPVFVIESVDIDAQAIIADRGYLQSPVGIDLHEYGFQFQLLRTGRSSDFALSPDVQIFFSENLNEPVPLDGLDALAAKVADGYIAWRFEAVDGVITSLTAAPWRERLVYKLLEPITDMTQLHVQILREVRYPYIEDTRRLDPLGLPPETLNITAATEFFTDRGYSDPKAADFDALRVPSTAEDLQAWSDAGGQYLYVERDGAKVLSVYGIYSA